MLLVGPVFVRATFVIMPFHSDPTSISLLSFRIQIGITTSGFEIDEYTEMCETSVHPYIKLMWLDSRAEQCVTFRTYTSK